MNKEFKPSILNILITYIVILILTPITIIIFGFFIIIYFYSDHPQTTISAAELTELNDILRQCEITPREPFKLEKHWEFTREIEYRIHWWLISSNKPFDIKRVDNSLVPKKIKVEESVKLSDAGIRINQVVSDSWFIDGCSYHSQYGVKNKKYYLYISRSCSPYNKKEETSAGLELSSVHISEYVPNY